MLRKILLPLALLQLVTVLYAKDEIWIDFGALPPGYTPENGIYLRQYDPAPIQEDDPTVVDYSNIYDPATGDAVNVLPSHFANQTSKDGNPAYEEMRLSLALDRWQIKLSSSSNFIENRISTQVFAYNTKDESSRYPGEQLLAAHFSFPNLLVNSKAWIVPEFMIPSYSAAPGVNLEEENAKDAMERMGQFLNKGVLRNVGPIRSITAVVYGRRFPLNLTIEAEHTDIGKREYPMGNVNFSGWQDLVWTNPNYILDVRKRSFSKAPEYPKGIPSIAIRALRLDRPQDYINENTSQIVFYIKQISVVYDEVIPEGFDSEIDDEQIWQLNTVTSQKHGYRTAIEARQNAVDRYVELQNRNPAFPSQDDGGGADAAPAN